MLQSELFVSSQRAAYCPKDMLTQAQRNLVYAKRNKLALPLQAG
jgi:hypothetical protein